MRKLGFKPSYYIQFLSAYPESQFPLLGYPIYSSDHQPTYKICIHHTSLFSTTYAIYYRSKQGYIPIGPYFTKDLNTAVAVCDEHWVACDRLGDK